MTKYKCSKCLLIIQEDDLVDGCCPVCNTNDMLKEMCPNDRICSCAEEITTLETTCPVCGVRTCPCGSHAVIILSRITGYISEVEGGWNAGKKQEFKDRKRYDISR